MGIQLLLGGNPNSGRHLQGLLTCARLCALQHDLDCGSLDRSLELLLISGSINAKNDVGAARLVAAAARYQLEHLMDGEQTNRAKDVPSGSESIRPCCEQM